MRQQQVLDLLRQGGYVSGETICQRLDISRAAIWKIVDGLRREGYEISAKTGLGYRLESSPDILSDCEIRPFLQDNCVFGHTLICLETVGSTNTYAKTLAQQGACHGTAVVADCQSAGRGRMARDFHSPAGTGIYMTLLLRPQVPTQALMGLTALSAVAVCQAVESVCGLQAQIKWPNDIVVQGKKLCGILTELSVEGETGRIDHVALGLGINVGQTHFPENLSHCAISLRQLGYTVSRPQLAGAMLQALEQAYGALTHPQAYLDAYRSRCVNLGRTLQLLRLDGTHLEALGAHIDETFALVVEKKDGTLETLQSGEVSVQGFYGA